MKKCRKNKKNCGGATFVRIKKPSGSVGSTSGSDGEGKQAGGTQYLESNVAVRKAEWGGNKFGI